MMQYWSQDKYVKAWDFATIAHEDQTYGGPEEGQRIPYINHIGSVAMELLCGLFSDEKLNGDLGIQCALLHDTLEDTEVKFEQIESIFGSAVAMGVLALTKDEKFSTKRQQMEDSIERIKCQPKEVWMVKLADRITNLSEPPFYWSDEKRLNYKAEAEFILAELGGANDFLSQRLSSRIQSYDQYIKI